MATDIERAVPTVLPDALAVMCGYINWSDSPAGLSSSASLTSQTIFARGIYLPAGKVVTNIVLDINTGGTGTAPTGFFVGLASPSKMLAQSNNLNASASLTTVGNQLFALNATYTTSLADSATGLYYVCVLQNGAFGTVNMQLQRSTGAGNPGTAISGGNPPWGYIGTGQTALPSNGSAITVSTQASPVWVGVA